MPTLTPEQQAAIQSYLARTAGQRTQAPPSFMGAMRDPEFWKRDVLNRASQAAQGGAAGILGAPVDIASAAMRPFGLAPAPEQTVGSSDWFGKLMGADPSSAPFLAGSIGAPDPTDVAKVAAKFDPATISAIMAGIPVFHGSPHKFEAFDLSKIGTGEGAQAYGHGLYFAEDPRTAGTYQRNVKDNPAINAINKRMGDVAREMQKYEIPGAYRKYRDPKGEELANEYDALMVQRSAVVNDPGNLYHVDIPDEAIEKMLDWDKPLSEQPEAVFALFDKTPELRRNRPSGNPSGRQLYKSLEDLGFVRDKFGPGPAGVSAYLNSIGVPGIKYLDAGSRTTKEGTSNIVLFDDKLAKITKRE